MAKGKRKSKRPGLSPGTAVFTGEQRVDRAVVRLFDYDAEELSEQLDVPLEALKGRAATPTVTWVDVVGLHDVALIQAIGAEFGVHPLTIEDIVNPRTRAKLEDFDTYAFFSMKVVHLDAKATRGVDEEAVSVVLGPTFVLTFQEMEGDAWDPVRERIRSKIGRIRRMRADYLAYALLDAVVDGYFVVLEDVGERLQVLEGELLDELQSDHYPEIHELRRLLLALFRAAAPLRETVSSFERLPPELVQREIRPFLRDVSDHAAQVNTEIEIFREIADNLVDIFHAETGRQQNQATMLLSVIATLFLPLTFIAGVYGMNFVWMPELAWPWGYPAALLGMALIATMLMLYFRRRGWL